MRIERFDIPDVVQFEPHIVHDSRGSFSEIFREDLFRQQAGVIGLVQENQSVSLSIGTIRGLHFQTPPFAQGKLVRVLSGSIFDVVVDLRQGSPTFGRSASFELSAAQGNQLWVPAGFAHGFCTLQLNTTVCYKVTAYYHPDNDAGIAWDDPEIGIEWPACADPGTLSAKDRDLPPFGLAPTCFTYAKG